MEVVPEDLPFTEDMDHTSLNLQAPLLLDQLVLGLFPYRQIAHKLSSCSEASSDYTIQVNGPSVSLRDTPALDVPGWTTASVCPTVSSQHVVHIPFGMPSRSKHALTSTSTIPVSTPLLPLHL